MRSPVRFSHRIGASRLRAVTVYRKQPTAPQPRMIPATVTDIEADGFDKVAALFKY